MIPVIIFLIVVIILAGIRVINEYERGVVFTLGKYTGILKPGLNFVVPLIQRVVKVDIRVATVDIPSQKVITKDNVSLSINGVAYIQVIDPKKAVLNIQDYLLATALLCQATLRDVIGNKNLDEVLSERQKVAEEIRKIVDTKADEWGVDISEIKLQDIVLPTELERAMARQAEAEREKRAVIIKSEGEIQAAQNLVKAAKELAKVKEAVHLRTLQTITDISADQSSKFIFVLPIEVMEALLEKKKK